MRHGLLYFSVFWLAACASTPSRAPSFAGADQVMNAVDACRKDAPLAASSFCASAKPGYQDCRADSASNSVEFCIAAEAGYKDCRQDYANSSATVCLHAKSGFADCRRDYLNFGVNTCLKADAEFQSCRTKKTAADCLSMTVGER